MGKTQSAFPSEKIWSTELKKKNNESMTLKGCVLDLLLCLSTPLSRTLICLSCCRETEPSRQFHHHHAGACPSDVERDLLSPLIVLCIVGLNSVQV